MLEVVVAILATSNAFTLYWAFTKRLKVSPKVIAIQKAIRVFDSEGEAILHITRINPDDVFLKNPSR